MSFSVIYNDYNVNILSGMTELLESGHLADVTLAVDGHLIKAHKAVLSINSAYFRSLFASNPHPHPIFFIHGVKLQVVNSLLVFMYLGTVQIDADELREFVEVATNLQVKGMITCAADCLDDALVSTCTPTKEDATDATAPIRTRDDSHLDCLLEKRVRLSSTDIQAECEVTESIDSTQVPVEASCAFQVAQHLEDYAQEENAATSNNDECVVEVKPHLKRDSLSAETIRVKYIKCGDSLRLQLDDHSYTKHRVRRRWTVWRCTRCPNGQPGRTCMATVRVCFNNSIMISGEHNHEPIPIPFGTTLHSEEMFTAWNINSQTRDEQPDDELDLLSVAEENSCVNRAQVNK